MPGAPRQPILAGVAGIVLAAGWSSRMGSDKALLGYPGPVPWPAESRRPAPVAPSFLIACLAKLRSVCGRLYVVLGHNAAEIAHLSEAPVADWPVAWLRNTDYERGQFSSLRMGSAAALAEPSCRAALVAPVDHPDFRVETLAALVAGLAPTPAGRVGPAIVKPSYEGRHGHPLLYARAALEAIVAAGDEATARELQAQFPDQVGIVAVSDAGILVNVDTPAADRTLRRRYARGDGVVR